jgi:hypothetical protein
MPSTTTGRHGDRPGARSAARAPIVGFLPEDLHTGTETPYRHPVVDNDLPRAQLMPSRRLENGWWTIRVAIQTRALTHA